MDELLTNLIGQKDRVSGEILQPGEKVYICEPCQLGYHKDSWEFLNKVCEQCNSSIQNLYTLPLCITFRDISPNTNNNSFINADNLLRSGLEKANNQNYGKAIKYFSQALQLNSNLAEAYYHRGVAHSKLENFKAAIKDFTQAIRINVRDAKSYFQRGNAYFDSDNFQASLNDYIQAVTICPDYHDAYFNLGIVNDFLGKKEIAIDYFSKVINFTNDPEAYYYRANIHSEIANIQAAIKDYKRVLNLNPNHKQAQINLDLIYYQINPI